MYLEETEFKPKTLCYGITNRCSDGSYILFADYDNINESVLFKELENLLKRFPELKCFMVLESSEPYSVNSEIFGSYHVISFTKMPYHKMREVLSYMSVDDDFFQLPAKTTYRCNTLRISPKFSVRTGEIAKGKPGFLKFFPCFVLSSDFSMPHLLYFISFFKPDLGKDKASIQAIGKPKGRVEFKKYYSLSG